MRGFCDFRSILLCGGNGGNGSIAFSKLLNQPFGPPSGGNGGKGANVLVQACKDITTLEALQDRYIVPSGGAGKGKFMHGLDGKDIIIKVPVGTVVNEIPLSETRWKSINPPKKPTTKMETIAEHFFFRQEYTPQADRIQMLMERIPRPRYRHKIEELNFMEDGQTELVFRGGRGGLGNPHFRTPQIAGPAIASYGEKVEPVALEFELKTIADIGLIGLPNAGKSTLLKAVSNAHPKIAPYPFTTLNPYVGTIDFADYFQMTVADMPGIIPGAHENVGLGLKFLRHIERTKIFVFVIDIAGINPSKDLHILRSELEKYQPGIIKRPSMIVANKADISTAKDNLNDLAAVTELPIVPISAKFEKNIQQVTSLMRYLIEKNQIK